MTQILELGNYHCPTHSDFAHSERNDSEFNQRKTGMQSRNYSENQRKMESFANFMCVNLKDTNFTDSLNFNGTMQLNGSSAISFIPIGQYTAVTINGQWQSPSFIGSFYTESTIDNKQFNAVWNILSFNREIPDMWSDNNITDLRDNSFGVNYS